jgi:hypothetical protein
VIFECKTINTEHAPSEASRCRFGLAQLIEYRLVHGDLTDGLCLVTNSPIKEFRIRVLESVDIGVMCFLGRTPQLLGTLAATLLNADARGGK